MSLEKSFAKAVLKNALLFFTNFVIDNEHAPKYAKVSVLYKGENMPQEDIIALYTSENNEQDPNDDQIMFYCNGIEEFISLIIDSKEDFIVTGVFEFVSEL